MQMKFTDKQRIKFREEIERVLSEDKLTSIFSEYPEKFGDNFYNQISGNNYRTRLINLIIELNNRELIFDFIKVVRYEYHNFAQDL
ncbi:hypothetical protein Tery_2235 [Trichodesmium erythraeum IMS101]|uniref:Uncharacterized protein n=2 Tax=Trichodesmium erythraeum TaxID=1206 RepID=Q112W0_TRIEI